MKKLTRHLILLLLLPTLLMGQDIYFEHYKVENGLPHNTIISSLQDHNGFMWFGTKNGAARFDGHSFKQFKNNPNDPKGLMGNYVECLHEFENKLYLGTENGLYRYNERLENFDLIDNSSGRHVLRISNDDHGNLWYVADGAIYKYQTASQQSKVYTFEEHYANTLIQTKNHEIWIAAIDHLLLYDAHNDEFIPYPLNVPSDAENPFRINILFNLDSRTLLIGTQNHGVVAFDTVDKKVKPLPSPMNNDPYYVRDFALKGNKELWVASESGIHIYNFDNHTYTNLVKNYEDPYALADNAVYSLTVDNAEGVWAGTYFGGINYHAKPYSPFKKFFPMASHNSIHGNAIREIHKDMYGNLWIGSEDAGLNKYNPKTGIFTFYNSKDKDKTGPLTYHNVHGVLPIRDKLWIGMFDHGIDVLDIKTGRLLKHYQAGKNGSLLSNFVFTLYQSKSGTLFAVTTSGIQTYNAKMDRFDTFQGFPIDHHYTCFFEDAQGVFWAGTWSNGLFYYNPRTKEMGSYTYQGPGKNGIAHNHINGIFQDSKERIWITTENGLDLLDPTKRNFTKFATEDGFPSNIFYSILEDGTGLLWISTSNGLVQFNPEDNSKKIYTKANGIKSDQFNYNSGFKDTDGTMYFGSVDGMIAFNPDNFLKDNSFVPPIFVTGLQVNNMPVQVNQKDSPLQESILFSEHLTLQPNQSSFSLEFSALSFAEPENTEYWYKMKGLNNDWVSLNKEHKVNFTELAGGSYTFTVKAMNSCGVYGKETPPLHIKILPVFWKSNFAYSLYTILALLLVYFGFRIYHGRIRAKNIQKLKQLNARKEKEIYEAKIEFFTNISHEIRTPLTLIYSPLEKVLKKVSDFPSARENLAIVKKNTDRLLALVNQLLDFRKTEIENINLTFVENNLSDLVQNTSDRFSEAIKDKEIEFRLDLGEEDIFAFVDAEALKKILSNLFGNAIKYGKTLVLVRLQSDGNNVELTIKNDGELIPQHLKEKIFEPFYRLSGTENQTGTGIGLALARSLTEMHHGSLTLDTTQDQMNCFVLKIPVHQEKEFKLPVTEEKETSFLPEAPISLEPVGGGRTILLVEDSKELLDFVSKELQEDYTILTAPNGKEALKILAEENVQLIVSDVMMPLMDGFALCKEVKTNLETSHIPVVLLTSKSAMAARLEGLESGADAHIEKPFSIKHLKVHIANLLENRRHVMEHYASSPLAHIRSIATTQMDETFIKKLDETILQNMADNDLNVETLAEIMHMSRSTLYRKIKEISNLSPNELINLARLKKSAELLKTGKYRVFEVAEIVGYNSATSFGRNFQKQFEMSPSEYMNTK